MPLWISNRLPTQQDGDLHGMVLWGKQSGLLMEWHGVRPGEHWARSAAWTASAGADDCQEELS